MYATYYPCKLLSKDEREKRLDLKPNVSHSKILERAKPRIERFDVGLSIQIIGGNKMVIRKEPTIDTLRHINKTIHAIIKNDECYFKGEQKMNSCILIGRLTKDPEIKRTGNGTAISQITLAVERGGKPQENQPNADFIDIKLFNKTAENVCQYKHKGDLIGVVGRIRKDTWNDQQGNFRSFTYVVGDRVEFLANAGNNTQSNQQAYQQPQQPKQPTREQQRQQDYENLVEQFWGPNNNNDDLPF